MKPVMKDRSHSHQEHTPKMARLGEGRTSRGNIGQPTSLKLVQDFLCKGKRRGGHQKKDRGQKEEIRGKKGSASEMEGRTLQRKDGEWQGTAWMPISGMTARQRSATRE